MKSSELRIGNYVYENEKHIKQIEHIYNNTIYTQSAGKQFHTAIPLTKDWLLKFGFKKYKKETDYDSIYELKNINIPKSGYFEFAVGFIENEINIFLYSGECLKHIKYVHQLQNLYFALTEEELTISS